MALNYQREVWDEDCIHLLELKAPEQYSDFHLAHEIAHYVVADPIEREFPEFGCEIGIASSYATGGIPWEKVVSDSDSAESTRWKQFQKGVLTKDEQNFREACADFLGVYWCDCFGIHVESSWRPAFKYAKDAELAERARKAIVWLRERNLLP